MQRFVCYLITTCSGIFFWCGGFLLWETFGGEVSWNLREGITIKPASTPYECLIEETENGNYLLSATCILRQQLPEMSLTEIVDTLWEDVVAFEQVYDPHALSTNYYGSSPIYREPLPSVLVPTLEEYKELLEMEAQGIFVEVSKKEVARYLAQDLSFFASEKELSLLGPCTRRNYLLALQHLDTTLLAPGGVYNANKELARIRSYCTGRGETHFLFYGGVCGMTSQFFRVSLIHPSIEIVTRWPHNEWFTVYYGKEVGGDDAAIYEMSKQFEIKNIGQESIYFRALLQEQDSFLVAISPRSHQWVQIEKTPIHSLAMDVKKTVFAYPQPSTYFGTEVPFGADTPLAQITKQSSGETDMLVRQELFESRYVGKNNGTR